MNIYLILTASKIYAFKLPFFRFYPIDFKDCSGMFSLMAASWVGNQKNFVQVVSQKL